MYNTGEVALVGFFKNYIHSLKES